MEPESGVVSVDAIAGTLAAVRQPADAICDRWTLEIVLHLLSGARRYSELLRQSGMASRLVASRLAALQDLGVVDRRLYSEGAVRYEYFLTDMGSELRAVLGQMIRWERNWRIPASPANETAEMQEGFLVDLAAPGDCAFCLEPVTDVRPPGQRRKARPSTSREPFDLRRQLGHRDPHLRLLRHPQIQ